MKSPFTLILLLQLCFQSVNGQISEMWVQGLPSNSGIDGVISLPNVSYSNKRPTLDNGSMLSLMKVAAFTKTNWYGEYQLSGIKPAKLAINFDTNILKGEKKHQFPISGDYSNKQQVLIHGLSFGKRLDLDNNWHLALGFYTGCFKLNKRYKFTYAQIDKQIITDSRLIWFGTETEILAKNVEGLELVTATQRHSYWWLLGPEMTWSWQHEMVGFALKSKFLYSTQPGLHVTKTEVTKNGPQTTSEINLHPKGELVCILSISAMIALR